MLQGKPTASVTRTQVALISGDGVGPEVTAAVTRILDAADAQIEWIPCAAGQKVFEAGDPSGLPDETIATIRACGTALKAPLATPIGRGERSANVRLRETFDTFSAIRPVKAVWRSGGTTEKVVDILLVRENLEDLYIGVEYTLAPGLAVALKVTTEQNTTRICHTAFRLAQALGRKKVTGISKSNILKQTDGQFDRVFNEISALYPDIKHERMLVDAAACKLVTHPEHFDVVVTSNLYGDILSDLIAGLGGGLGLCASVNVGCDAAIFEAVHGTAPDIAGKGLANPTALLRAAIMMLDHLEKHPVARRVERALEGVIQQGLFLTADLAVSGTAVSTDKFAEAIIDALDFDQRSEAPHAWKKLPLSDLDGTGWPPENLRKTLAPFFQASHTFSDQLPHPDPALAP